MEEQVAKGSHFIKVLIPGFHQKLNLPPAFCTKLKQEKSEWVMLKSGKGTSRIKVCRNIGEGRLISLEFGWPQFVDNHSLHVGDFLVFEHVGGLNFNVFVFDPSCCEKQFKQDSTDDEAVKRCRINKDNKRETEKKESSFDSRTPHFITTVSPFQANNRNRSRLNIPIEFVRSNNVGKKTNGVALRNERGRAWRACLCVREIGQFRAYLYGKGWRDFYDCNELKPGDICVFYLNPNSPRSDTILFDVKIFPSSA